MRLVATQGIDLSRAGDDIILKALGPGWFPAKITGSFTSGGGTFYTWSEQEPLESGLGYRDVAGGKTGTGTQSFAREIGGSASVATNTIVLMRPLTIITSGSVTKTDLYEFIVSGNAGANLTQLVVTDVTCSGSTLAVTKKTLTIPGGTVI